MNIFDIIKNLFTQQDAKWVLAVEEKDINPPVILRFLCLSHMTKKQARIMSKFMYTVPPQMFLSALWSLLYFNGKKMTKAPFIKYPKKTDIKPKYEFIIKKLRQQYDMSERDFEFVKPFVLKAIEEDKVEWFSYYGINKTEWDANHIAYERMKDYGDRPKVEVKKGLDAFF